MSRLDTATAAGLRSPEQPEAVLVYFYFRFLFFLISRLVCTVSLVLDTGTEAASAASRKWQEQLVCVLPSSQAGEGERHALSLSLSLSLSLASRDQQLKEREY